MSTPNDGGAAFPVPPERTNVLPGGDVHWTYAHPGMTLRQYAAVQLRVPRSGTPWLDDMIRERMRDDFAAAALQGFMAGPHYSVYRTWSQDAQSAYEMADAMLAEHAKTEGDAQP